MAVRYAASVSTRRKSSASTCADRTRAGMRCGRLTDGPVGVAAAARIRPGERCGSRPTTPFTAPRPPASRSSWKTERDRLVRRQDDAERHRPVGRGDLEPDPVLFVRAPRGRPRGRRRELVCRPGET